MKERAGEELGWSERTDATVKTTAAIRKTQRAPVTSHHQHHTKCCISTTTNRQHGRLEPQVDLSLQIGVLLGQLEEGLGRGQHDGAVGHAQPGVLQAAEVMMVKMVVRGDDDC